MNLFKDKKFLNSKKEREGVTMRKILFVLILMTCVFSLLSAQATRQAPISFEGVKDNGIVVEVAPAIETNVPGRSVIFQEGFSSGVWPPAGWISTDLDSDSGPNDLWRLIGQGGGPLIGWSGGNYQQIPLQAGFTGYAASSSWCYLNQGGPNDNEMFPNNWLISPIISIPANGAELSYWVSTVPAWPDYYGVYISLGGTTIGGTNNQNVPVGGVVGDFTKLLGETAPFGTSEATAWNNRLIPLSAYAGQNVRIAFRHYNCGYEHTVTISNVRVEAALAFDLAAISLTGPTSYTVNNEVNMVVTVRNVGGQSASGYTVRLMREGVTTPIDTRPGTVLAAGATTTFTFPWTPTAPGNLVMYGDVVWAQDENQANNRTPNLNVIVRPEGLAEIMIGNPNSTAWTASYPWNINWRNSLMQTIIHQSEIGDPGQIIEMEFHMRRPNPGNWPNNLPVYIYLANVPATKTTFASGTDWIPLAEFTQVYNAPPPDWHTVGDHWRTFALTTPFIYTGGNLVVMTGRPYVAGETWWSSHNFQNTAVTGNRTLSKQSDSLYYFDPANYMSSGSLWSAIPNMKMLMNTNLPGFGSVQGTVMGMGEPLQDVTVTLSGAEGDRVAQTNADGFYRFAMVTPGSFSLTATKHMWFPVHIPNVFVHPEQTTTIQTMSMSGVQRDLVGLGLTGPGAGFTGAQLTYQFTIRNDAVIQTLGTAYTVRLMREGTPTALASTNGVNINSGATQTLNITWTPAATFVGANVVYAEVVFAADQYPNNNRSDNDLNVTLRTPPPPGVIDAEIGDMGSTLWQNTSHPWDINYRNNMAQTIYYAGEIGGPGVITELQYHMRRPNPGNWPANLAVEIYMANIPASQTTFATTTSWIPMDQFTRVFFAPPPDWHIVGDHWRVFELETPFTYTGGNLVIMTGRPYTAGETWWSSHPFQTTATTGVNRTLAKRSDTLYHLDPANYMAAGTLTPQIANIKLFGDGRTMGHVSGVVRNTTGNAPMADVVVTIGGRSALTNAAGEYTVGFLNAGSLPVTVDHFGFNLHTSNVTVVAQQTTTHNINLTPRPRVSVAGVVRASDTNAGLADAVVKLTGYENYETTTNPQGQFSITGVFAQNTYTLNVQHNPRFTAHEQIVVVANSSVTVPVITLQEKANPATNLVAALTGSNVDLQWRAPFLGGEGPGTPYWFTHSIVGPFAGGIGTNSANTFSKGHRYTAAQLEALGVAGRTLTAVEFGVETPANVTSITARIFSGGTWSPTRNPGTLLHTQPMTGYVQGLNQRTLTSEITIPMGAELWIVFDFVVTAGVPMGRDDGPNIMNGYTNIMFFSGDWATLIELAATLNNNYTIKGFVTDGVSPPSVLAHSVLENNSVDTVNEAPFVSILGGISNIDIDPIQRELHAERVRLSNELSNEQNIDSGRVLLGYNVYRLQLGQEDEPSLWTTLFTDWKGLPSDPEGFVTYRDTSWPPAQSGTYRYAVRALYSQNNLSTPAFQGAPGPVFFPHNMTSPVIITVNTSDGSTPTGATAKLFAEGAGPTGDDLVYESSIVGTANAVSFEGVWHATYTLTVDLSGFETYTDDNFEVYSSKMETVTLTERANAPRNVTASAVNASVMGLTWEAPGGGVATWMTHCNEQYNDGIGTGGVVTFDNFHRFTVEDLAGYQVFGGALSVVSFWPGDEFDASFGDTITILVYRGGTSPTAPGELVHTQPVPVVQLYGWNDITLTTPVDIIEGQELWIGYRLFTDWYTAGADSGPREPNGKGDLMFWNGWTTLLAASGGSVNANWMIKGYTGEGMGRVMLTQNQNVRNQENVFEPITHNNTDQVFRARSTVNTNRSGIQMTREELLALNPSRNAAGSRAIENYRIFRGVSGTPVASWTQLGEVNGQTESFNDNTWHTLGDGIYRYAVRTVYTGDIVSDPGISNPVWKGMEVPVSITMLTLDGGSPAGAIVKLEAVAGHPDGSDLEYEVTTTANVAAFPSVFRNVTYTLTINAPKYQRYVDTAFTVNAAGFFEVTLTHTANSPRNVVAIDNAPANARIEWDEPGQGEDMWISWANDTVGANVGADAANFHFHMVSRYTQADLVALGATGGTLTQVAFRRSSSTNSSLQQATIEIRRDGIVSGTSDPLNIVLGDLLHTQVVPNLPLDTLIMVTLTNPVPIPSDGGLWIQVGGLSPANLGHPWNLSTQSTNAVPPYRGCIYAWGTGPVWNSATHLSGNLQATWMVYGFVEDATGGRILSHGEPTVVINDFNQNPEITAVIGESHGRSVAPYFELNPYRNARDVLSYRIWRLAEGQEGNETSWTLLNNNINPNVNFFVDSAWPHASGVWRYAVKALYTADILSSAAISNILGHNVHFNLDIAAATTDGNPVTGAVITITGFDMNGAEVVQTATIPTGSNTVRFQNLFRGDYDVRGVLEGYTRFDGTVTVDDHTNFGVLFRERASAPSAVIAHDQTSHVILEWSEPGQGEDIWFTHAGDTLFDSAGLNGDMIYEAGLRFSVDHLAQFGVQGATLTQVAIMGTGHTTTQAMINVYAGGTSLSDYGTLVHTQAVPLNLAEGWHIFQLSEGVAIPEDKEMIIVYATDHPSGSSWPHAFDAGPILTNFSIRRWTGQPWSTPGFPGNFMVRGMASGATGPRVLGGSLSFNNVQETNNRLAPSRNLVSEARGSGLEVLSPIKSNFGPTPFPYPTKTVVDNDPSRVFEHYRIHRTAFGSTVLSDATVVANRIFTTTWIDMSWFTIDDGAYWYAVEAIYTGDNASNPAFSNVVGKNVYADITFNVSTADGASFAGGKVTLVNNQTNQVYSANAIGNIVELKHIFFGQYTLTIEHPDYAIYRNNMFAVNQHQQAYAAILALQAIIFSEGFDGSPFPPTGWTNWDQDGDGNVWGQLDNFGLTPPITPQAGTHFIASRTWMGANGFNADNWMISPQINIEDASALTVSFYIAGEGAYPDHIEVLYSTTGINTGVAQGTLAPIGNPGTVIGDWTSVFRGELTGEAWAQMTADLSGAVGNEYVRLAFRHRDFDMNVLALDSITLISGATPNFGTITGFVTNLNGGTPVVGAEVGIVGTEIKTTTNAQGLYFLNVAAGTVQVTATAAGLSDYTSGNIVVSPGRQVAHQFQMGAPGIVRGFTYHLREDGTRTPLPGVLVELLGTSFSARSVASGAYLMANVPAGNYEAQASLAGYNTPEIQRITVLAGQTLEGIIFDLTPVSDNDGVVIPLVTALQSNFPNPFNPSTVIAFDLAQDGHVTIDVFNIRGQRVTTLTNEEWKAGKHKVEWDGTDSFGREAASGVYFYNMRVGEYNSTRRMILMK